jgi:predicted NAD-dependent protein-ADP-ribosyltransferase YbiA (DUF1768 family)
MELFPAEAEAIKKRVEDWLSHPNYELEATFGTGTGEVDAVTFLTVAQRLRAKNYTALPQEDRLDIRTPEHFRFSLSSLAIIQAYCEDDTLAGKPFVAMIKDRATPESQVDLDDYATRIKVRRETPLAPDDAQVQKLFGAWPQQRKAFRMIRRWTFEGEGIRIDMSIVRSTAKGRNGEFRWQRKFRDQDILTAAPTYEIEVELMRKADDTTEDSTKRLIRGVGEVLRGIQKNTILIRTSVRNRVIAGYKDLVGTDAFRGPALRTLRKENMTVEHAAKVPNIRDGYNVTDKADGLRTLGYVDSKGTLYLIDMGMNVYRTGLSRPELRLSLVDGEWVTQDKDKKPMQQFLVFDIFFATDKKEVSKFPFQPGAVEPGATSPPPAAEDSRYNHLKNWIATWNKDGGPKAMPGLSAQSKLQVAAKEFAFASAGNDSIFRMATRVLTAARPYYTDGLIFTPNATPLPERAAATFWEQFKWKPARDNTIDFLVITEKLTGSKTQDKVIAGIKPGAGGETVNYKTLRLYVGSSNENARDIILNGRDLPKRDRAGAYGAKKGKGEYKPVVFTPKEFPDPMASVCKLEIKKDPDTGEEYIMADHTGEPIQDRTIVEMAYDPSQPPGWRWVPLRVRMDKTERLQRGTLSRTLNSEGVAEDVWNSIYDPVTETMIKTGAEDPTEEELALIGKGVSGRETLARRYFDRQGPIADESLVEGLKKFHGRWVKGEMLYKAGLSGEGKALLDLACGVGGDMHNWMRAGANFVLGIDYAAKNIMDTQDSAYTRYMGVAVDQGGLDSLPPMIFAIADCSKPLVSGEAGSNEQEKDILRSVFGRTRAVGSVPAYVEKVGASRLKTGADCVSCMFAVHYFFESTQKLNGFLGNLADTLKLGGYFVGACFDGQRVFDLLRETATGAGKSGQEGTATLWNIVKQYDVEDIPEGDGGVGLGVDVEFLTIGMGHREYLVPFRLLQEKLKLIGCELLTKEELKDVGLPASTGTFDTAWDIAAKKGKKFPMGPAAKQFSFMNRWFVFKRKRMETMGAAVVAEAEAAAESMTNGIAPTGRNAVQAEPNPTTGRAATARQRAEKNAAAATAIQNVAANLNAAAETAAETEGPEAVQAIRTAAAKINAAAAAVTAAAGRTVPVAPGPAAAPGAGRTYTIGELLQFYTDAAVKDTLGIKDPGAARWLALSAPFPIKDPEGDTTYPTVEHYIGGMRAKMATNKPELATTIFSREGTIHQRFLNDRLVESNGGTKPLTEERDHEILKAEVAAIKDAMRAPALKKHRAVVDEAKWATVKDAVVEEALKQRWTRDDRFRKIVTAARDRGKTLLYYTPGAATSNLGGMRATSTGRIEGDNKVGKIIMKLAGYPDV